MKPYQDKQLLELLYEIYKSQSKVAEVLKCNEKTVAAWMKKFEIVSVGAQGARKRNVNNSYFKEIDTEEKAYWLGFIYADAVCIKVQVHTPTDCR